MPELLIDFITSLDGYAAAEGWPGWWGMEGPEYLGWLGEAPEADYTVLMGATTYRLKICIQGSGAVKRIRPPHGDANWLRRQKIWGIPQRSSSSYGEGVSLCP